MKVTLYRLNRLYLEIYMYRHMHNMYITTMKIRGHELETARRGIREGLERGKGRGKWCNYIIISKTKQK